MIAYLDNAATTRVWPEAAQAAAEAMTERYFNPSSRYPAASGAAKALEIRPCRRGKGAWDAVPGSLPLPPAAPRATTGPFAPPQSMDKRKGKHIITTAD